MSAPVSIRLKLIITLSSLFLLAWFVLALMGLYHSRQVVAELLDSHLAQTGQVLMGMTLHELDEMGSVRYIQMEEVLPPEIYHEPLAFRIWVKNELLLASNNAPPFSPTSALGYGEITFQEPWRVLILRSHEMGVVVVVGMPQHFIASQLLQTAMALLFPLLIFFPLMVLSIWFGVSRGLQPLRQVAEEIAKRSPQLLEPVNVQIIPREILFLVGSLNQLLARLGYAMDAERRFTANAAHELRTPLASLKVHAQVALRSSDDQERQIALQKVLASADRAAHLVQQLLTLSRLDPELANQHQHPFSPSAVAQEVIADLAPAAMAKNMGLELCDNLPDNSTKIMGIDTAFAVLVRNLVDNAIRYVPDHGQIMVTLEPLDRGIRLLVDDNGPGIPPSQRQNMFARFCRGAVQDTLGCGLGLSIVMNIVALHQGRITLQDSPLGGLQAEVILPGVGN